MSRLHRQDSQTESAPEGDDGAGAAGSDYNMEEDADREMSPPQTDDGPNENFKVAIRVRPPVPRELNGTRPFVNVVRVPTDHKSITLCEHLDTDDGRSGVYSTQSFTFDRVYEQQARQQDVYEGSAQSAVLSVLQGYNATVIAYGQTGTGKTFTMEGFTSEEQRGIIPRSTEEVFAYIHSCRMRNMKFQVRASYLQIYNEQFSDLLKPLSKQLTIRQTAQHGVHVEGLSEWVVRSPNEIYGLMERGCSLRATGTTKLSELSSRSHAIFIITVEIVEGDESEPRSLKVGKLNIVDLAGSEKVHQTGVTGARLEETKKINWSLHMLGIVISTLTFNSRKDKHIPYRNSKLTHVLMDSLGGNCKTTFIACISPASESYSESLMTLRFANSAKNIKNNAVVNEELDPASLKRKYERELRRLRGLLEAKSGGPVDGSIISELEERNRQAVEDREAALEALEERSKAFNEEKRTKAKLEERIYELEQLLLNGEMSQTESRKLNDDYAQKVDELDKERQVMEEDKAQVDRYKQLLLKQRDIMLNLTTRLNERDETILSLQEEIDAYDAHVQMLEDALQVGPQPAMSTRIDAQEHLTKLRVVDNLNQVKYRSEANPAHLLNTEEKIIELLMLKGMAPLPPNEAFEKSDDRKNMELILRDRVDTAVQRQVQERYALLLKELDDTKRKLSESEERRRAVDFVSAEARQGSGGSANERLMQFIQKETDVLRAPYTARITDLQNALDTERYQRRRLAAELDKMKFEVSQVKSLVDSSHNDQINHLWDKLQEIEDAFHNELIKTSSPTAPPAQSTRRVDPNASARRGRAACRTAGSFNRNVEEAEHELAKRTDGTGRGADEGAKEVGGPDSRTSAASAHHVSS